MGTKKFENSGINWYICTYVHIEKTSCLLDILYVRVKKRTGKEFEKQDLQSSKVFPSAQGKMVLLKHMTV